MTGTFASACELIRGTGVSPVLATFECGRSSIASFPSYGASSTGETPVPLDTASHTFAAMDKRLPYRSRIDDELGDMAVEHEPHLQPQLPDHPNDPPLTADSPIDPADEDLRLLNSVWDEPTLSPQLAGAPRADELTWTTWLAERKASISWLKSWGTVALLALVAGPWAVLGAFWGSGQSAFSILVLVSIGPAVEELMKISAAMYIIEKRPYLFRHPMQIVLCGLLAGLSFAAIENVLYLYVYIPDASRELWLWRWTVCVALHVGCTLIASLGLVRVWTDAERQGTRPQTSLAFPYLVTATVVHGVYNGGAMAMERLWGAF